MTKQSESLPDENYHALARFVLIATSLGLVEFFVPDLAGEIGLCKTMA
ncbi:MAG: hypothetical protein NZ805_01955 [Armatimonadetes bacterium]|nr:hypothetical protein [Armatimonadota bacterium]